jgi:hypothetical protein
MPPLQSRAPGKTRRRSCQSIGPGTLLLVLVKFGVPVSAQEFLLWRCKNVDTAFNFIEANSRVVPGLHHFDASRA